MFVASSFSHNALELNNEFIKFTSMVRNVISRHALIKSFTRSQSENNPNLGNLFISIRQKQWLYKTQFLNGYPLGIALQSLSKICITRKKLTVAKETLKVWNILRTLLPYGKTYDI